MPKRVLVVDDEPTVLRLMTRALEGAGFVTVGAESVAAARQVSGPWDVLVVDLGLPNGDADDVARLYPEVPMLTVSGQAHGADLRKPFMMSELVAAVQTRIGAT